MALPAHTSDTAQSARRRMPRSRRGTTSSYEVAGTELVVIANANADGSLGEVFATFGKEGSTTAGLMDLLSIAISDILIIILRPDNQDFQGTAVTVDIARSLDVPNLILMVNKAVPKYDFADLKKQIVGTFNAPVAGILPLSFDMAENASKDLFSLRYPDHEWSKALRGVAEAILAVK